MMKKTIAVLISMFMILSLAACGNSASRTGQSSSEENPVEESADNDSAFVDENADVDADLSEDNTGNDEDLAESAADDDTAEESNDADDKGNEEISETQQGEDGSSEVQETKVLVAYFSATNTTEGVAENIANGLQADLYEIIPEDPYTDADLNYNDNNSRTTIEMNDPNARPAISGSIENMEEYDVLFIGFPIWWGEAPRIVSTFMESYDFSGKTIVPFCTSGGSGMGSSAANLEQLTSGAQWLAGQRLNGSDSQEQVMEWVNGLGLDL